MRRLSLLLLLCTAACAPTSDPQGPAQGPDRPASGWRLDTGGDLNAFFDCLEAQGVALVSAHRGGPAEGYPENSLAAIERTLSFAPALIEIDVAQSSDGALYLMHDETLERTTTGSGRADALDWDQIAQLRLEDETGAATPFRPPLLSEALAAARGRTLVQVDIKRSARYEDVVETIRENDATDRVIFIAYSLGQAKKLHRLAPEMMISLQFDSMSALNAAVAQGLALDRLLGFTGIEEPDGRLFSILNDRDVEVIFGTLGGRDSFDRAAARNGDNSIYVELAEAGVDIIATDRPLAAHDALLAAGRGAREGVCGVRRG